MTAPTGPSARHTTPPTTYGETTDGWATEPGTTGRIPTPAAAPSALARARRTVSMRVAAIIAVVAFLVGLGVSMLLGPIMGGPGGPGGQGGPPGISTSQTQTGTGTGQTGT